MYNAIILTDYTDGVFLTKTLGPYKVAHELRKLGVDTTVINYAHMWDLSELLSFLDQLTNDKTLFVGINNFYVRDAEGVDFYSNDKITLRRGRKGQILPHGGDADNQFISLVKSKKIPLVLGGPTAVDQTHNSIFDYLLQGFTDTSIASLVKHLIDKCKIEHSYRSISGPIVIQDTNSIDNWDFSTSTMKWDEKDAVLPGETLTIEVARGCIFKCKFCAFPLIGKKKFDYIRHYDVLKQELIDNWERFGVTKYFFGDETFNDSMHKVEFINKLSSELPFQLEYFAYLRLDLMIKNPESMEMLYRSGLRTTHFGIETFHPAAGKAIGKNFNVKEVKNALTTLQQISNGEINLHSSFIIGLPHEPKEHILETYNMLKSKEIPLNSFVYFPLYIRRYSNDKAIYNSIFSKDYTKYGYTEMPDSEQTETYKKSWPDDLIAWSSDTMNCIEATELANQLETDSFKWKSISASSDLQIASLGFDSSFYRNKTYNEIDWAAVTRAKISRFKEYKTKLMGVANNSHN